MVPASHVEFLKQPLSFWLATTGLNNISEPIKCTGIVFDPATEIFTCFVPEKFMTIGFEHLRENPVLALVVTELHSFESYQYKGNYLAWRRCTEDEVEFQRGYMEAFSDILGSFGHSKQGLYGAYFHIPVLALTFQVTHVFDQSPRSGTGEKVCA
ncbi:hypothetical protein [Chryseolinea lacunae]|uniref:Pyridoxamine 5'-phosphate oxidase putative domain-containing protein n=1 Tax=Chryseolinea lacunae TaxID=2801331 RepID=A0ABS1KYS1_9BACT|nr:hypothetical protein [Chryseolinea lacunae]MBL0744564.1 hypothetical protein [Chryseolinea lacunae]